MPEGACRKIALIICVSCKKIDRMLPVCGNCTVSHSGETQFKVKIEPAQMCCRPRSNGRSRRYVTAKTAARSAAARIAPTYLFPTMP